MKINGVEVKLDKPVTITDYLNKEGYNQDRVAVEKNKKIVPRKCFSTEQLIDDDIIEIIHLVGGG